MPDADLAIMRRLDRLAYPFAGSRMLRGLLVAEGCKIGRRHVKTLMKRMGIEAAGISLDDTCLRARRRPAQRQRDPVSGSYVELREPSVAMASEKAQAGKARPKVAAS